jgi:hypothetical protein
MTMKAFGGGVGHIDSSPLRPRNRLIVNSMRPDRSIASSGQPALTAALGEVADVLGAELAPPLNRSPRARPLAFAEANARKGKTRDGFAGQQANGAALVVPRVRSKKVALGQNAGGTSSPPAPSQRSQASEFWHVRQRRLAAAKATPLLSRAAAPGSTPTRSIIAPISRACR